MHLGVVLRPIRAAVFAAACVALTAGGHELAGGHPIGPAALGAGLVGIFTAGLFAAGRDRSRAAIVAGVFGGQAALHVLFSCLADGSGPAGLSAVMSMPTLSPTASMADMAPAAVTAAGSMPGHSAASMPSGVPMLGGHLAAGLIVAWWLGWGETVCTRLLRHAERVTSRALQAALTRLRRRVRGPDPRPRPAVVAATVAHEPGAAVVALLTGCVPRRGPPPKIAA